MNPLILKRWLTRLRSGKYKQGRSALKSIRKDGEIGYCCLGLLCDIHRKMTGQGRWERHYEEGRWYYTTHANRTKEMNGETLPEAVKLWAGLTHEAVNVDNVSATILNDGDAYEKLKPHSFRQIANRIEEAAKAGTLK